MKKDTKWEMMTQIQEGDFELTLYWNKEIIDINRRYKVEELAIRRGVITISKKFIKLDIANKYFKKLCLEANEYKNSRFSGWYK
jgi:hypothetical protein